MCIRDSIIALCGDFQILDSCQLLESGTVLEFFIRGINEPADRVVFFRNNRFSLTLHFDAFPDTFLCVFPVSYTHLNAYEANAMTEAVTDSAFK